MNTLEIFSQFDQVKKLCYISVHFLIGVKLERLSERDKEPGILRDNRALFLEFSRHVNVELGIEFKGKVIHLGKIFREGDDKFFESSTGRKFPLFPGGLCITREFLRSLGFDEGVCTLIPERFVNVRFALDPKTQDVSVDLQLVNEFTPPLYYEKTDRINKLSYAYGKFQGVSIQGKQAMVDEACFIDNKTWTIANAIGRRGNLKGRRPANTALACLADCLKKRHNFWDIPTRIGDEFRRRNLQSEEAIKPTVAMSVAKVVLTPERKMLVYVLELGGGRVFCVHPNNPKPYYVSRGDKNGITAGGIIHPHRSHSQQVFSGTFVVTCSPNILAYLTINELARYVCDYKHKALDPILFELQQRQRDLEYQKVLENAGTSGAITMMQV